MITWTVNVVLGVYIGILVISTTTGQGGSVVQIPVVTEVFFPTSIFLSPLSQPQSDQTTINL